MKKLLLGLIVLALGLLASLFGLQRLTTGRLTVTSEPEAEIFLLDPAKPLKPTRLGIEEASARLKPGTYTVEVAHEGRRSRAAVNIERGEDSSLHIPLELLRSLETVAAYTGRDITTTTGTTSFLNVGARQIYTLASGQSEATRFQPVAYPVVRAHWLSSNEIVVEEPGKKYQLIGSGSIKDLPLDGVIYGDAESNLQDLVVNSRGQIAYATSNRLYFKNNPLSSSTLLLKLDHPAKLAISPDGQIAVYFSAEEQPHAESKPQQPFVINPQTKKVLNLPSTPSPIEFISWNINAKQLVYFAGTSSHTYDLSTQVSTPFLHTRPTNPQSFTWTQDHELIYIDSESIWRYDAKKKLSVKLAETPGEINHSQPLNPTQDGRTIYFGTDAPSGFGSVGKIYRLKL